MLSEINEDKDLRNALYGNRENRDSINCSENREKSKENIFIMVSSPIAEFAITMNNHVKLGYEPYGAPITEVNLDTITMHQCLVDNTRLKQRLEFVKEKEEIINTINACRKTINNIQDEILATRQEIKPFTEEKSTFGDFIEWLLGWQNKKRNKNG